MQMDKDYIEQFDVIRRYHQHKLSDEELDSFEIYILENPDIINVIEQEKAIHDAFKEHEGLFRDKPSRIIPANWASGLAVAACLVVAVLAVFNLPGTQPAYDLQPAVRLETFRGAGDAVIQASGQPIVHFQVDMGPPELLESNNFMAELVDASGNALYRAQGLQADAEGWLYYALEGQDEPLTGTYEVRVYPADNPSRATTYSVQLSTP